MASQFQVHIKISAGSYFSQDFYITNPDMTPMNITGAFFTAVISKHSNSFNAVKSTKDQPVYSYTTMNTKVSNGVGGVLNVSMTSEDTAKLKEGKYVYNVNVTDINGYTSPCVSGLVFVDRSFGSPHELGVQDSDDIHVDDVFY